MSEHKCKIEIRNLIRRIITSHLLTYRRVRYGHAFRLIPLSKGKFAKVDPEDYETLAEYKWTLHESRKLTRPISVGMSNFPDQQQFQGHYALRAITINGLRKKIWMHREIMESKLKTEKNRLPVSLLVDHINRDTLDNRKSNLRIVTPQQNTWNRKCNYNSQSGYKGVHWDKSRKRWRVKIRQDGRNLSLGYFNDPIDAAKAYDKAVKELRGEFAYLNFPD